MKSNQTRKKHHFHIARFLFLLLVVGIAAVFGIRWGTKQFLKAVYPLQYEEYVRRYATQYQVDESLIYGVIHTESRFKSDAVSHASAKGLMQLTDETFEWAQKREDGKVTLSSDSLYDAEINIHYGCVVFSLLKQQFEQEDTVLAAYNAGQGNVRKWLADENYSPDGKALSSIPISETRDYITKVRDAQKMYQKLYKID